eukprot:Gregarina_sp_Poly_1__1004@NODE_1244_length_4647_cov_43_825546_g848_i0_p3_GENE_NODE_1244_length_4647_cov_43_825546_g848_i0NODE_1244_length_4647_cov_43_825546_g848_i0_p3_ORF_typecomplete_len204_score23_42_NODE_1244_length_4647_cov_43_825546_g848_i011021713
MMAAKSQRRPLSPTRGLPWEIEEGAKPKSPLHHPRNSDSELTVRHPTLVGVMLFVLCYLAITLGLLVYWRSRQSNIEFYLLGWRETPRRSLFFGIGGSPNTPPAGSGSKPDFAFARGTGSVFWLYGNVLEEYPFMCLCDATVRDEWYRGEISNNANDYSPVPCRGQPSTSLFGSATYCDPTFQVPEWYTTVATTVPAASESGD